MARPVNCVLNEKNAIVSATGAGDVAIAGFLAAFLAGKEPEQALDAASAAAAICLQSADTSGKLLPLEEMMRNYRGKAIN